MSLVAHNGLPVPPIMYGTAWKKEATAKLVQQAVGSGFTAIDTANQLIHYDEAAVGNALLSLREQGVKRENLFLQTKFTSVDGQGKTTPYDAHAPLAEQVRQSFDSSLTHLHVDEIDSYVLHGPYSRHDLGDKDWEVWHAIEDLHKRGKTRMIGISNVSAHQLSQLCAKASTIPMFVQNRCFAINGWDFDVRSICKKNGIIYQGFSLLTANSASLSTAPMRRIAHRLDASIPQVIFKFATQIGMLPLTGTTDLKHMKEDLESFKLELTDQELLTIEKIAVN